MRMQSRALSGVSLAALASLVPPSAMCGSPRADADPKKMVGDLTAAFGEFKDRYERNTQAAIDDINARIAAGSSLSCSTCGAPWSRNSFSPRSTPSARRILQPASPSFSIRPPKVSAGVDRGSFADGPQAGRCGPRSSDEAVRRHPRTDEGRRATRG